MRITEVEAVVAEGVRASDPEHAGMYDYRDLQELVRRLTHAARTLLDERQGRPAAPPLTHAGALAHAGFENNGAPEPPSRWHA